MSAKPQTGEQHQDGLIAKVFGTRASAGSKGLPDLLVS
jgi:hypothetical protein